MTRDKDDICRKAELIAAGMVEASHEQVSSTTPGVKHPYGYTLKFQGEEPEVLKGETANYYLDLKEAITARDQLRSLVADAVEAGMRSEREAADLILADMQEDSAGYQWGKHAGALIQKKAMAGLAREMIQSRTSTLVNAMESHPVICPSPYGRPKPPDVRLLQAALTDLLRALDGGYWTARDEANDAIKPAIAAARAVLAGGLTV